VSVHTNVSSAGVYLRNELVGVTPLARPIFVAPGRAALEIRAEGYAVATRELALERGRTLVVDVSLVPVAVTATTSAEAPQASATPITAKWWFWTGVGVVVAGGAAVTIALLAPHRSAPEGDIEPRQVTAPLLRF
jgi:hypothetical protein